MGLSLWAARVARVLGDPLARSRLAGAAALQPAARTHSCTAAHLGETEPFQGNGRLQLLLSRLPLSVPECHCLQSLHADC